MYNSFDVFHCYRLVILSYSVHIKYIYPSRPTLSQNPFPHILKTPPVALHKGSSKMKHGWLTHLEKDDKRHRRALHKDPSPAGGLYWYNWRRRFSAQALTCQKKQKRPNFSVNRGDSSASKQCFTAPFWTENSLCLKGTIHPVLRLWIQS